MERIRDFHGYALNKFTFTFTFTFTLQPKILVRRLSADVLHSLAANRQLNVRSLSADLSSSVQPISDRHTWIQGVFVDQTLADFA